MRRFIVLLSILVVAFCFVACETQTEANRNADRQQAIETM